MCSNLPVPFITLEHVSLRVPGGVVFEDTSWEIRCGQQWAVLGPNGSGRSHLLRAIFGKVPVVQGRILYHFSDGGGPLESGDPVRDQMAYVSSGHGKLRAVQGSGFYQARWSSFCEDEPLLVSEFVFRGTADPSRANRSHSHPHRFAIGSAEPPGLPGIEDLMNKRMISLSDGELRRVMIAEALIRNPRLLVLENPFAGLDVANKGRLRHSIGRVVQQGAVLILTTARNEEIPDPVTHILLVDHHRVVAQGPRDEILERARWSAPLQPRPVAVHDRDAAPEKDPEGPVLLQMSKVSVTYDSNRILDEVSWEVRKGEHWALVGPNGAGKTTLLSLILGDNPQAYANRVALFGRRRGSGETIWEIKARVGWVSPELHLYYPRRFSCLEVVCSGFFDSIGLHRRASDEQRRAAESLLTRLGIGERGAKGFKAVSYGEQRVVLLARALVKNPMLLVLDEPCQGLDGLHRELFLETVNDLGGQGQTTVILVTHERDELPGILTHALLLEGGRVVRKGRIEEVLKDAWRKGHGA